MTLGRDRLRKLARPVAAALLVLLIPFGWRWGSGNFGTVVPGQVYRAAQPGPRGLNWAIRTHGIKTVINLRGPNPDQSWYRAETQTTRAAGVTQVDVPLASDHWLTGEEARNLVDLLETAERPLLIHCEWGAERTGLASAFATLLRPGSTVDDARGQFAAWYLFVPTADGRVMRGHIDRYRRWLAARELAHTPATFRRWAVREYTPGTPSRADWPCNPYPLRVVTRPGGRPSAVWPADRCPKNVAVGNGYRDEHEDEERR